MSPKTWWQDTTWTLNISCVTFVSIAIIIILNVIGLSMPIQKGIWYLEDVGRSQWWSVTLYDHTDRQWWSWINSVHVLLFTFIPFLFISKFLQNREKNNVWQASLQSPLPPIVEEVPRARILFYCIFSLCFMIAAHDATFVYPILIATCSFAIARIFKGSKLNPVLTWLFNILIVYSCDYYSGYSLKPIIGPYYASFIDERFGRMRWYVYYKICMLRSVSYNLDTYWMENNKEYSNLEKLDEYNQRAAIHHHKSIYSSYLNFLAYTFYLPLYIAGPIISFNAFISYVKYPDRSLSVRRCVWNIVKVLLMTVFTELWCHFSFHNAMNATGYWKELSLIQIAAIQSVLLHFMYLKFYCIWRFFGSVAHLDGICAPDNMPRCIWWSLTFQGFWRSWHGSLNKWIVRYLYVPLGGRDKQFITVWLIFFFIGLWHDLWWNWVAWAMLNCCCFSFEILVGLFYHSKYCAKLRGKWYSPFIETGASCINAFMLMLTNLSIIHTWKGSVEILHAMFVEKANKREVLLLFACIWIGLTYNNEYAKFLERRNAANRRDKLE